MQEMSADHSTAQPRAAVFFIEGSVNGNLLKSARRLFNESLSLEAQLQPGLPIVGTLSITTPIAHSLSQVGGYVKPIRKRARTPAKTHWSAAAKCKDVDGEQNEERAVEKERRKRAVKNDSEYGVPVKMVDPEARNIAIVTGIFRLRLAASELKSARRRFVTWDAGPNEHS